MPAGTTPPSIPNSWPNAWRNSAWRNSGWASNACTPDMRRRPCFLPGRRERPPSPPPEAGLPSPRAREGSGAPNGASISLHAWRGVRTLAKGARRAALHVRHSSRAFRPQLSPGSALPGTRLVKPVPVQQAPCRAAVVPPGRVPEPPGSGVTNPARRHRLPPRPAFASHENAPLDGCDGIRVGKYVIWERVKGKLRHPEVRAKRASKDDRQGPGRRPSRAAFGGHLRVTGKDRRPPHSAARRPSRA